MYDSHTHKHETSQFPNRTNALFPGYCVAGDATTCTNGVYSSRSGLVTTTAQRLQVGRGRGQLLQQQHQLWPHSGDTNTSRLGGASITQFGHTRNYSISIPLPSPSRNICPKLANRFALKHSHTPTQSQLTDSAAQILQIRNNNREFHSSRRSAAVAAATFQRNAQYKQGARNCALTPLHTLFFS